MISTSMIFLSVLLNPGIKGFFLFSKSNIELRKALAWLI